MFSHLAVYFFILSSLLLDNVTYLIVTLSGFVVLLIRKADYFWWVLITCFSPIPLVTLASILCELLIRLCILVVAIDTCKNVTNLVVSKPTMNLSFCSSINKKQQYLSGRLDQIIVTTDQQTARQTASLLMLRTAKHTNMNICIKFILMTFIWNYLTYIGFPLYHSLVITCHLGIHTKAL